VLMCIGSSVMKNLDGDNMKFKLFLAKCCRKIRGGNPSISELRLSGAIIGDNCHIYGCVDSGHEFLISIGNNVTLASGCRILSHDGSTKKIVGYSRVGRVDIGDNVFVGANAIVLPNVKIGNKVIVGAGSVVTKDIPDNSVAVGNPARVIGTYDAYVEKTEKQLQDLPTWDTHYTKKTDEQKQQMRDALLDSGYGFDL